MRFCYLGLVGEIDIHSATVEPALSIVLTTIFGQGVGALRFPFGRETRLDFLSTL